MANVTARLRHAWNAFLNEDGTQRIGSPVEIGASYGTRSDRTRLRVTNERSIIASIYTRLSIDVASVDIRHVRLGPDNRYLEDVSSGLNNCLTIEANIDQAARAFRQDIAMTLFDKGVVALVPVDTTLDPAVSGSYDIKSIESILKQYIITNCKRILPL